MNLATSIAAPLACAALALAPQGPPAGARTDVAAETKAVTDRVLRRRVDLANPPAAFPVVNKHLREAKSIRGRFVEEKQIKVLKRPLSCSGVIVFSGPHGLYRATEVPFAQELLVTTHGLAQRDAAGKVDKVGVAEQPLAKGFIDAFLLVFSGDDKALSADFELYFDGDETKWAMGFVPTHEPLSKFISSLVVTGWKAKLETLAVTETNGDVTFTRFSNVSTNRELTEDERQRWFGWGG